VAWAVRQGGAPVLDAIRVEAERLGAHPVASEVVAPCVQALAAA
jgi:glutamate formiminotransferase